MSLPVNVDYTSSCTDPSESSPLNEPGPSLDPNIPIQSSVNVRPCVLTLEPGSLDSKSSSDTYSSVFTGGSRSVETPSVVLRRPTIPSKHNRRKLVSLLDTIAMEEYCSSLSPEKCVSSPNIIGEPKSPQVLIKRKTGRPQSWTSLKSLTNVFKSRLPTSLENLGSAMNDYQGSFVYEFEGMCVNLYIV